jgi:SAM-dependent methyltransferase
MLEITEHDRKYWRYEYNVVSRYLIPLLKSWKINFADSILLDVGCGDGGGISAFYDAGFICKGFDIESRRVELANRLRGDRKFEIIEGDIYSDTFPYSNSKFDLIVLHDVFEHLEDKEQVLNKLSLCLNDSGKILITFPPYYSAFGAHQQLMSSKICKIPFLHLVPFAMSYLIKGLSDTRNPLVAEIKKLIRLKMGIGKFESL